MLSRNTRFSLVTNWRFVASVDEVAAILADVEAMPDWWGSAFLIARMNSTQREQSEHLISPAVDLRTRGWLPYSINWQARLVEHDLPYCWTFATSGDFEGRGEWRFAQNGEHVDVEFHWDIVARKPIIHAFASILKPLFVSNHRWAMEKGREGVERELLRRRKSRPLPRSEAKESGWPNLAVDVDMAAHSPRASALG